MLEITKDDPNVDTDLAIQILREGAPLNINKDKINGLLFEHADVLTLNKK